MEEFTRRTLLSASAAALGAGVGVATGERTDDPDTDGAPSVKGEIKRFSTTALGAEVTGPFVFGDGTVLYSLQHPSRDNPAPYDRAGIGYFSGFRFEFDGSNDDFEELSIPETNAERGSVRGSGSDYVFLARERDPIAGGGEELGVVETPDGRPITREEFAGTQYADPAYNPDCNQFVPTDPTGSRRLPPAAERALDRDDGGIAGYLFTNWENSPGNVTRIPLRREDGEWTADLENALNLANTEPFRELGGTRINCYGDRTPWGTVISSEEHYAHARTSMTATVSDVAERGTGRGLRGVHEFWNRPNPSEIQAAVGDYFEDDWYVQGYWNAVGVEFLAYYLGADPVDQDGEENTVEPIGDVYPNPYRYGYHVEIRAPTADPPRPVKHYAMGRAAWEAPDVQADRRTVYGCSDGDSKGIYRFVADRPIDGYDDPMDLSGTLYAPKVTNPEAAAENSPAAVDLEIEWLELGSASNREVDAWIADYDGVTQVDYLRSHSDWSPGNPVTPEVLEAADRDVVENGNRDYVTDEEILAWADQYETRGPDGVDEELRRVPFLETRAAAKEVGASIEFNKAEGVDSVDGAAPGDYVYFGVSEFNDDLSNDEGDVRMERVDGGVVYRGRLDENFEVTTLEPVVVGPDGSDPAAVADDALLNVDNVYAMRDGRVICCEDASQFGRSYSNDCLWVYEPEETGRTTGANPRDG